MRMLEATKTLTKLHPEPEPPRPPIIVEHTLAVQEKC